MVILFYEVTVSLTDATNVKIVEEKIKRGQFTTEVVIVVMEIQIKTINYRLPFLKRLFNKFWMYP